MNPPENSPQEVKALQAKFNETLVAAFKQYGKAMDVGDSPMLTRKFAGGAMTQEKDHPGHFALGLDLEEISASNYKGRDQQPNAMQPKDIIRHELFHFVDFHPMESALKETRAVWFVNQFQMAEGRCRVCPTLTWMKLIIPGLHPPQQVTTKG